MKALTTLRIGRATMMLVLCGLLCSCAGYTPKPLPKRVHWNDRADLRVDASRIALPALSSQSIDLRAPLTIQAITALAVLNDPDLKAARDKSGLARAQAFAAGLLPDPQFSASRDIPQGHSEGVSSTAYNLGVDFNLSSLLTRGASVSGARAHLRQIDLEMLWREWQIASAAETDYIALVSLRDRDHLLRAERDATSDILERTQTAVLSGVESQPGVVAVLANLQTLQQQLTADARERDTRLAVLDALLGLSPGTPLALAELPRFDPDAVREADSALRRLPEIRPDLMALRAGYDAQEEALRKAVLMQFPSIGISLSRARDTSDVNTFGFGVTFSLPVLNGNRGAIRVQQATRRTLYDDYVSRLNQSQRQVKRIMTDIGHLRRQKVQLLGALPTLEATSAAMADSLRRGESTLPQRERQQRALLDQRLAIQTNARQLAEQTVALQLLTGRGVFQPATHISPVASRHGDRPLHASDSRAP